MNVVRAMRTYLSSSQLWFIALPVLISVLAAIFVIAERAAQPYVENYPQPYLDVYVNGKLRTDILILARVDQEVRINAAFMDQFRNLTKEPGPIKWSVSDESIATIVPTEDPRSICLQLVSPGIVTVYMHSANIRDRREIHVTAGLPKRVELTVVVSDKVVPPGPEA